MAAVNPNVPETQPKEFLSYSRGISQPESDKSAVYSGKAFEYTGDIAKAQGESALYQGKASQYAGEGLGTLFEGIGNLFKQGVSAADTFIKKGIDDKVYSAVDAERNQYISELEQTKTPGASSDPTLGIASTDTLVHTDPKTGQVIKPGAPMNLIQQSASAPNGIQQGIDRAGTIVEARANDKMTETAYIGNLNAIVKGLRTQYPGYREYIDQKISESTGMIPANAYVKSLLQDINAQTTAGKSEMEKTATMLREEVKKGTQGAPEAFDTFQRTGNVAIANQWVNKQNAQKNYWDNVTSANAYDASVASNAKLKAGQQLDTLAPQILDNHFDSVAMRLSGAIGGGAPGTGTAKDLVDLLQKQQQIKNGLASGQPMADDTKDQIAGMLRSQALDYVTAVRAEAIKKGIYANYGNPEEFEKRLDGYAQKFTRVADLIQNKDFGLAGETIRQNRAMAALDQNKMMTSPELGMQTRLINAVEAWPNYAQKMFDRLNLDEVGKDGKPKTLSDAMKDYIKQQRMLMQTPTPELLGQPPQSPKQSIQKINLKTGGAENTPVAATNLTLNMVHDITDPKVEPEVRARSAQAAFQNSNRGMLNEIQKDYVNRNGQKISGQIDVYKDFTSPDMTNSIKEMSGKQPGLMRQYQSWAKDEFSNILLRQDITSLRDIQNYKGMVVKWSVDNNGIARFDIPKTATPTYDPQDVSTQPGIISERREKALYHVDRINQALENYSYLVKQAGGDINAEMIGILSSHGVKPTGVANMRIPEHMLEAVLNGANPPEKGGDKTAKPVKTETIKALPFSDTEGLYNAQRGSLGDYLSNPAGYVAPRAQNAPAVISGARRGNLTDSDILGIQTIDIPEGMSPSEAIRRLR